MNNDQLKHFYSSGIFSAMDLHFARFIEQLAGKTAPELFLATALVSHFTRQRHICLDLSSLAGKCYPENQTHDFAITCPKLNEWQEILRNSLVVGEPGEFKPLILDHKSRLYLFRYWEYEEILARLIKRRIYPPGLIAENEIIIDSESIRKNLNDFFPTEPSDEVDWQKVAAVVALIKKFCVISGGPGTGKTMTVAKILAVLLAQAKTSLLRIALAAPTGKAASRMQEAIKSAKAGLNCPEDIKNAIPEQASTIHRLLGSVPDSPYFRHNAENPLPVDLVVVDEASMMDLALMSKLVQSLAAGARLILLGDKDQLASVEAGAVFADICDRGEHHGFSEKMCSQLEPIFGSTFPGQTSDEPSGIQDCIIPLQKNYRFGSESGIGKLSRAVNAGDGRKALEILKNRNYGDIQWQDLPDPAVLGRILNDSILHGYKDYLYRQDVQEVFELFDQFRVLGAIREGPYGIATFNLIIEQILKRENLIHPDQKWYHGRPVMITSNNYQLQLFNGDVGIALRDPEANNDLRVFFSGSEGKVRKFHPFRLPDHETVFAMTVHKSQGSEFDQVLLILPDKDYPVLTRELIYTGITRAKKRVTIWGSAQVFQMAISRRIERASGLRDALWQG